MTSNILAIGVTKLGRWLKVMVALHVTSQSPCIYMLMSNDMIGQEQYYKCVSNNIILYQSVYSRAIIICYYSNRPAGPHGTGTPSLCPGLPSITVYVIFGGW